MIMKMKKSREDLRDQQVGVKKTVTVMKTTTDQGREEGDEVPEVDQLMSNMKKRKERPKLGMNRGLEGRKWRKGMRGKTEGTVEEAKTKLIIVGGKKIPSVMTMRRKRGGEEEIDGVLRTENHGK